MKFQRILLFPIVSLLIMALSSCEMMDLRLDDEGVLGSSALKGHAGASKRGEARAKSGLGSGTIIVSLPADRCKAGTIRFGATTCKALGRGRTAWSEADARAKFGSGNYTKGRNSAGQTCYFLKASVFRGATPKGTYTINGGEGYKSHWGQSGIALTDRVPGRGNFLIHSDVYYDRHPKPDAPIHSSYGCVKVSQSCLTKLKRYKKTGMKVEVR